MGKRTLILAFLASILITGTPAAGFDRDLHFTIQTADSASPPELYRDVILFTYEGESRTRTVSLAFEHENFRQFHTFERNANGLFILTLPPPRGVEELRYRLIVDGLWTVDPMADSVVDQRGIRVSRIVVPTTSANIDPGLHALPDGRTRFVYQGRSGSRVALVGDFNRWDPYLTPMTESQIHPGLFVAEVLLPTDARFYRFIVDGQALVDPANPVSVRNGWGETASPIQ